MKITDKFRGETTRRAFIGGAASLAATCGLTADDGMTIDWSPSVRWRGVNLLGMFRCPSIGLKPDSRVEGRFVEWEFEALREWGFNFARLPLDYRILTTGDSWTNLDESKMKFLDEAIDWGRQYGVHVQIALHRIPGYCILDQTEAFPLGTSSAVQRSRLSTATTICSRTTRGGRRSAKRRVARASAARRSSGLRRSCATSVALATGWRVMLEMVKRYA